MKGKRLALLLSVILTAFPAAGVTVRALAGGTDVSAAEDAAGRSEHVERTVKHTVPCVGYAVNSSRQKPDAYGISTIGIGGFSGSFGAQLREGSLERTVYDALVSSYVKDKKTDSVRITCQFPFEGTGEYDESEEYLQAEEDLEYVLKTACGAFQYDYPEVFWIKDMIYAEDYFADVTYGDETTFSGSITAASVSFSEVYSGASGAQSAFASAISAAKSEVTGRRADATQYQTLKAIHDYICEVTKYPEGFDLSNPASDVPVYHSPAGVFLQGGVAACEGYAKAFMILCREFDIPAILVVGNAGVSHMWNYVQLQGSWYAVDATWDDTGGAMPDTTYFLIGSETAVPGGTFGSTRVMNTRFSGTENSRNFNYPVLNGTAYRRDNIHVHSWVVDSEVPPTCTQEGKIVNKCVSCGETTTSIVTALGHSFHEKIYVYNNDATVFSDGTQSLVCDNGCGLKKKTVAAPGTKLPATIRLNASSLRLRKGQSTKALKVSGLAEGDSVKSWSSTNTKIVKVSQSGKITAQKKTGTAKIRITLKSGMEKTVKVTVQAKPVAASRISGIAASLTLKKGKTKKLTPEILPVTCVQKTTYRSSNAKVASVSASGMVKAKKKGKATITVKCGGKSVKCKVTVK